MLTYIKKELKENDQEDTQNHIQKGDQKEKNIEDKENNYGYNNKSNITDRCG